MILEIGADGSWLARAAAATVLAAHITAGMVGIVSGATALIARKGAALHRRAGTWFFISMLVMATIGAVLAPFLPRPNWGNVVGGVFTLYLVATSWATIRRADGGAGGFAVAALLIAIGVVATDFTLGLKAAHAAPGARGEVPVPAYFVLAAAAALAACGDLRVLLRRGVRGPARVTRHLWRMCVALLIAASSFFLGQPQVFPQVLRRPLLLVLPELLIVGLLLFWLVRVQIVDRYRRKAVAAPPLAPEAG